MARPKTKTEPEHTFPVRIPKTLHKQFKLLSVELDESMNVLVERMIRDFVENSGIRIIREVVESVEQEETPAEPSSTPEPEKPAIELEHPNSDLEELLKNRPPNVEGKKRVYGKWLDLVIVEMRKRYPDKSWVQIADDLKARKIEKVGGGFDWASGYVTSRYNKATGKKT